MAPTSRKARAMRVAGLILAIIGAMLLSPLLITKLIADARVPR